MRTCRGHQHTRAASAGGRRMRPLLITAAALGIFLLLTALSVLLAGLICYGPLPGGPAALIARTTSSNLGNSTAAVLLILLCALWAWGLVRGGVFSSAGLGLAVPPGAALGRAAAGFGLGAAMVGAEMLLLWAGGQIRIHWRPLGAETALDLACALLLQLSVACSEELTFRGCIQQALGVRRPWAGASGSACIFAAAHLMGGSLGLLALANLFLAGLTLSLLRRASGSLWLPVGFHLANNWTRAYLWGCQASGLPTWFSAVPVGNTFWNGGNGEGSGISLLLLVLSLYVVGRLCGCNSRRRPPEPPGAEKNVCAPEGDSSG